MRRAQQANNSDNCPNANAQRDTTSRLCREDDKTSVLNTKCLFPFFLS